MNVCILIFLVCFFPFPGKCQVQEFPLKWEYRIYDDITTTAPNQPYKACLEDAPALPREFKGFIEYKAHFKVSSKALEDPLGIYLGQVGDVDKVYVNNKLIGQTGDFPPNYTNNMDVIREYVIPSAVLNLQGVNEIRVVTYVEYLIQKGLKISDVVMGGHRDLQQKKYANDIFEYSTRIVIPFLCLVLTFLSFPWKATKRLKGQTYLFCLALSGIIFGICRTRILFHFFDTLNVYKLTISSSIATVLFILLYAKDMTHKKVKILPAICTSVALGYILAVTIQADLGPAATVAKWWFKTEGLLVSAFLLIVLRDKGFTVLHKIGFSSLFLFVMNDILRDLRFVSTPPLFHVGIGIFVSAVIVGQIYNLKIAWGTYIRRELELESEAKFGRTIAQIAHDIRSPLEVLKGLKDDLDVFPEDPKRRIKLAMNRIDEITINLLNSHRQTIFEDKLQNHELLGTIESVLIEKSLEMRIKNSIVITFSEKSFGLFTSLQSGKLKSILSNLINNAADSMEGSGEIRLRLYSKDMHNVIEIIDSGKGISKNIQDSIFTKGFTTKIDGNGIGLYSARKEIEAIDGKLEFESVEGKGTTFRIVLKSLPPPQNHVSEINTALYDKIIILDDDPAFHEIWIQKLSLTKEKLIHVYSIREMLDRFPRLDDSVLLLSDFELMDKKMNGIDLILKLEHNINSILVTARSEEAYILERCLENSIKLIPKSAIGLIKVSEHLGHIILIDDEKLTHLEWGSYFSKRKIPFSSYHSVDHFLENASKHDLDARIYIDSQLGELRGEIESKKIYQKGFKRLYIATGYEKADIDKPDWILEIYPKSPRKIFL